MKGDNVSRPFIANPSVPEGCSVYAIGDIHGRLDLLDRLLNSVAEDVAATSPLQVAVVFLGDVVDRGADSCGGRTSGRRVPEPFFLQPCQPWVS
ncbi:MAG: metallophosphoesterase [Magnetospirillum gryphiswaldense]|nr:metallophosphoesterase [Magnetospirillum gryphiswaldense]